MNHPGDLRTMTFGRRPSMDVPSADSRYPRLISTSTEVMQSATTAELINLERCRYVMPSIFLKFFFELKFFTRNLYAQLIGFFDALIVK
jgi:hypothetical protein